MRRDSERLGDILEAIAKIEQRIPEAFNVFEQDETHLVWAVYHIQIIGEAAARLSEDAKNQMSEMPWSDVIAMRNVLVHQYFGIDAKEVWNTIHEDLPFLKKVISGYLE
ncbi:MAG: DUF86 domain-containing protein [Candidatus Sumerlaeia bacterium]